MYQPPYYHDTFVSYELQYIHTRLSLSLRRAEVVAAAVEPTYFYISKRYCCRCIGAKNEKTLWSRREMIG